jgi:mRNA interferase RelE/StbE
MTYKLAFLESAKKEWDKLDTTVREQFLKKLRERLNNPYVQKDKLSNMKDCYKIKLRSIGYRLVYKVFQERLVIQVVSVGKRDKDTVYQLAQERLVH